MGMIKLHGNARTVATSRALACLYEKALDFEFVPVNTFPDIAEHKKEPFISLNPFGLVPVLQDGDLKLIESRAITQYLATKYASQGNQLIYSDLDKTAINSVWKEVEAHQFDPIALNLTLELVVTPIFGGVTNDAVVSECEAKLAKVLTIYEAQLAQSKYLGGDTFTLVDLHHIPTIAYLLGTQVKALFDMFPRVSAWCTDILTRPAWLKVKACVGESETFVIVMLDQTSTSKPFTTLEGCRNYQSST